MVNLGVRSRAEKVVQWKIFENKQLAIATSNKPNNASEP
jgi:hypothetical protein